MRNYIILNGNNSNEITGLLIQSLPPISKPLMRTATEEIDGRDGDIVTTLGYSAYDKEISIGLYGSYDIDEVIKYFSDNSKGQVTFSNEPDKYYNYEIINQIDFERLIRFKTAIVTLHCQPFKYPTEETPVEINIQNITNEAEEMDLDNTADAPMTLALKGNTSQASDPATDSSVDVNVVSGDNTIEICGKNLLPFENINVTKNGLNIYSSNGNLYINGTNSSPIYSTEKLFEFTLNAGTFTSSPIVSGTPNYFLRKKSDNTTINESNRTFTLNETTDVYLCAFIGANTYNNYQVSWQLEKGTTSSEYEAYTGNSQLISLGSIELCKIGDYQDYIYKEDDKWYLHKEIGKVDFSTIKSFNRVGTWNNQTAFYVNNVINHGYSDYGNIAELFSNRFTSEQPALIVSNASNTGKVGLGANSNIFFSISGITTSEDYVTYFQNNPTYLYCRLTTPTDTEITYTTLLEQLENIANARSYDTSTHITQNANDKPFILNATAIQKGSDTGIVDNDGNIYSKPTLDIKGNGIVAIYLNGNQMFSVDLSNSDECVIDVTNLEAYDPETNELMNRQVTGDYSNFTLPVGENEVKVSGNVTKATISGYTRWL